MSTHLKLAIWLLSLFPITVIFWTIPVAGHAFTFEEYSTPTPDSSPAGLAFDSKGQLWFTEINTDKIGMLNPAKVRPGTTEGIVEYDLPHKNSQPNDIIVAHDGSVWFSEMRGNRIGRLDPATGKIREYPIPTPHSEPHNLVEGDDGAIWFAEFETDKIARLDPGDGSIREYPIHAGHPHDLVISNGRVWYAQGGKFWAQVFYNKIGYVDMKTGEVGEIEVPPKRSVPHAMAKAADGTIWFTQLFANKISRLDFSGNPSPTIIEYLLKGKRKGPHDLVIDDKRGWIWFALNRADSIGRLDLAKAKPGTSEGMEEFRIPTRGAHPNSLVLDADGNVWFTEMGHYFMGRYQSKIGKLVP